MQKLFNVQVKIKAISKDETNPFFKSKYFDINKLIEELRPVLNDEGLICVQPLDNIDGKPALRTTVIDAESGKSLVDMVTPIPENSDPQKMGSAITYFRRYALQSLFLLQAIDDDANSASANANYGRTQAPPEALKYNQGGTGKCKDCGADNIMYQSGKIGCANKCWLKK